MRKTVYATILLLALPFLFSACLDDDETTYELTSDALISSFSINDIETKVPALTADGNDTALVVTTTGSDYSFVINQSENRIYNPDSLPVGTDITRVSLNLTIIGYSVVYEKNQQDTLWTSADSLDFTQPVRLKVYAYDGTTRSYTAQINVHQQDPDSLQWSRLDSRFSIRAGSRQKAVCLGTKIYVFAEGEHQVEMTCTDRQDGKNWTPLQEIGIASAADYASVITFDGRLHILADDGLYVSDDGLQWSRTVDAADRSFSQLFAASSASLYGLSNGQIVESADASEWQEAKESAKYFPVAEYFPTQHVAYAAYPLATNSAIERLVVIGEREAASDTTAIVWSKLSTENTWTCHGLSADNVYGCPKLKELAVVRFDGKLYAFGGEKDFATTLQVEPFGVLYESIDNGLTWKERTEKVMLPPEFAGRTEHFSCVVDAEQFVWVMWSESNEVWRGRINRLGFASQEE